MPRPDARLGPALRRSTIPPALQTGPVADREGRPANVPRTPEPTPLQGCERRYGPTRKKVVMILMKTSGVRIESGHASPGRACSRPEGRSRSRPPARHSLGRRSGRGQNLFKISLALLQDVVRDRPEGETLIGQTRKCWPDNGLAERIPEERRGLLRTSVVRFFRPRPGSARGLPTRPVEAEARLIMPPDQVAYSDLSIRVASLTFASTGYDKVLMARWKSPRS